MRKRRARLSGPTKNVENGFNTIQPLEGIRQGRPIRPYEAQVVGSMRVCTTDGHTSLCGVAQIGHKEG